MIVVRSPRTVLFHLPINKMKTSVSTSSILLKVQGYLDAQGCQTLQQRFFEIDPNRFKLWILDLSTVDFMGSVGVELLVKAAKLAAQNHCRLAICNPHPSVQLVFEITQLNEVLDCLTTGDVERLVPVHSTSALRPMVPVAA